MIVCFSGTGNSLHVANLLAERLGDLVVKLQKDVVSLPRPTNGRIIWVFPVYSWGVPPVVRRWIATLDIAGAESVVHHSVMTCGDDVGRADKMWRKAIAARGWKTAGAYSVQMPNTYVLMKGFDVDSAEIENQKIEKAASRVAEIASKISTNPSEMYTDVVRGAFPGIKTGVIYPWFVKFDMSPRPFHSTDACVGCGACSRQCPMANIAMIEGSPSWGADCALCLGCYHVCPHHAVAYGKITLKKGRKQILTK